mgnify:CR=1 FL=1
MPKKFLEILDLILRLILDLLSDIIFRPNNNLEKDLTKNIPVGYMKN